MKAYLDLLKEVIETGRSRGDRTGTGTVSIFDAKFKHDMREGLPVVTTKKVVLRSVFEELMGFLNNDLHMECLVEKKVGIWDGWRLENDITREVTLKNHERLTLLTVTQPELLPEWHAMRFVTPEEVEAGHAWLDSKGIPRTRKETVAAAGDLNAPYGPGWRAFKTANGKVDQFAYAMDLIRNNPESRRILVSVWNPGWMPEETRQVELGFMERDALFEEFYPDLYADSQETLNYPEIAGDLDMARMHMDDAGVPTHKTVKVTPQENIVNGKPCLTPCHWAFEFYTEEMTVEERWAVTRKVYNTDNIDEAYSLVGRTLAPTEQGEHDQLDKLGTPRRYLSLKWHQRSCDMFLGIPFNIASYAILLEMVAQQTGMVAYQLIGDLTNVHIYNDHLPMVETQLLREPKDIPQLKFLRQPSHIEDYKWEDLEIIGYDPHPAIKGKPSI